MDESLQAGIASSLIEPYLYAGMNLLKLASAVRAPIGDAVVLKLDALSTPDASVVRRLAPLSGSAPTHDVERLRRLPEGTLGFEYARFLDTNGIRPLVVSDAVRARFRDAPYPLRYAATHDLHHVIAGFDAGLAGELGVLAFNVGQGSAPISRAMLGVTRALYTLASPSQAGELRRNLRAGLLMGRAADLVMAAPLEAWFADPLATVRERLRVPDPRASGAVPSGSSVVVRFFYPARRPSAA